MRKRGIRRGTGSRTSPRSSGDRSRIVRPDRRRDGQEKVPGRSAAESLGIVQNIGRNLEVKLADDESIGRSPARPISNQAARLGSISWAMRPKVVFTSRVSRSVSFFDAPGRSRTSLTPAFVIFLRQ